MRLDKFAQLLIKCAAKYPNMDVQEAEISVDNDEPDQMWLTLSYDETYAGCMDLFVGKKKHDNIDNIPSEDVFECPGCGCCVDEPGFCSTQCEDETVYGA